MKVSHRGLYALKALIHLAEAYEEAGGDLVKIHEIAEVEAIPEKFLEQILVTLKNARFVSQATSFSNTKPMPLRISLP